MIKDYDVVLKFGGSVIPDENGIYRVANVIENLSKKFNIKAIVVSAIGRTTSNLDNTMKKMRPQSDWGDLNVLRERAAYLATGEMQVAPLLAAICGYPYRSFNAWQAQIYTNNDDFINAKITHIGDAIPKAVSKGIIPVVAGFQGITKDGDLTTLGREGSDITAVVVGAKLKADFVWFFKDGGGIYDKNPTNTSDAKILQKISYNKMLTLLNSNNRNQVLHKQSVKLARNFNLPLFVSDINSDKGTWILPQVGEKAR